MTRGGFPFPVDIYYQTDDKLEGVYHRGQNKIWDGKKVLSSALKKYGLPQIDAEKQIAVEALFSIILWGEYAAWNVSSQLSSMLDDYGAKMAAVSQAHDEARHFYVMRDYLQTLGHHPRPLPAPVQYILESVLETPDLARKLLGMQLMIEPVALTIFRFVKKSNVDPVLTELLGYFEIDESRHVALGVKYLPKILKRMSKFEMMNFLLWQARMIRAEIQGLKYMEPYLITLGMDPLEVFEFTEQRQIECLKMVTLEMGLGDSLWAPIVKLIDFQKHLMFRSNPKASFLRRFGNSFISTFLTSYTTEPHS